MLFIIENLLTGATLERAARLARESEYISGAATADAGPDVKRNLEMKVGESYLELVEILDRAIESSDVINNRVYPRSRVSPIINRYDAGMEYREHIDKPIQGGRTQVGRAPGRYGQNFIRTDYSMTVFLTSPDSYSGGELELHAGPRPELVKLPAGHAVCYQTGIPHSVRRVEQGSRICAIYWFQSFIRDMTMRRILWDLHKLELELRASGQPVLAESAESIHQNFVRNLADI